MVNIVDQKKKKGEGEKIEEKKGAGCLGGVP